MKKNDVVEAVKELLLYRWVEVVDHVPVEVLSDTAKATGIPLAALRKARKMLSSL